jgi:hypothetical protein
VPDKNLEQTLRALLTRHRSLHTRAFEFDVYVHPENDPGCLQRAHEFLRPLSKRYHHALVVLDREGSGQESATREELEAHIGEQLGIAWGERAAAVVVDPELESWLWSDSPHVETVLGWKDRSPDLRSWLVEEGFLESGKPKPARPKEAVGKALWLVRKPRSSALYHQLAGKVSFRRCTDPAFARFQELLRGWFPP